MSEAINFDLLIPVLRSVARRAGAEAEEGVSVGWLMSQRAEKKGRGPGWVVEATRRILIRQVTPLAGLELSAELAEILPAPSHQIERWRTETLPENMEAALAGGSSGLAAKLGVTRRRAQQLLKDAADRMEHGDLFGMGG